MDEGKAETSKQEEADDFSAAGLENSCPPLAVISSRIKSHTLLASFVNPGVEVVKYAYESTSLQRLFQMMEATLKGRKALCIAFIAHGQPGSLKLCTQKVVSSTALREDVELKDFFTNVATRFLNPESHFARVDILASTVAQNAEGGALLEQIRALMKVRVYASSDIMGEPEAGEQGASPVRIGALYFDVEKLKDWNAQSQATMANYEKIKVVGKGAYGAAVLYRKKDDDSQVILKEINLLNLTKEERSSALNEVQVLKVLDHPHIISYYDNFEEEGVLMIEMEYADGGTLAQFLKQQMKPLGEEEILNLFSQMIEAIQYLHDHHILHRDLKTANVFLTKDRSVKVGDFGISKILSDTKQEANTVLGTPYYISPEICEGKKYNAKSDIWSLGCILYEMTCLQKTFDSTNLPALVHKIVQASIPPVKGDYSEEFKKLIQDLLQKDPERRPSANEICSVKLPPLMARYHTSTQQDIAEGEEGEEDGDQKNTKTTSLLLYLDGQTLLFNKIELPIRSRAAHVSIGFAHVVVVTQEGMAYSWGEGGHGQLGHGDTISRSEPQLVEALRGKSITRCECGGEFSIFLSDNGLIMSVGRGDVGAVGHGDFKDCLKPRLLEALLSDDIAEVSCGESHVAAVTSDGHVYAWGAGSHGRLGTGAEENRCTPTKIAVQTPNTKMEELVRIVRCGIDGTMYLTNTGRLFASGSNQDNKLGLNQRETFIVQMKKLVNKTQLQVLQMLEPTPVKELGKHRVTDMALGPTHSAVLVETGSVFTFGRNSEGQLCSGNTQPSYIPVMVKSLLSKAWMVTCSELSCIVLTEDLKFNIWGSRPIIKTPLADLLCPGPPKPPADTKPGEAEDHAASSEEKNLQPLPLLLPSSPKPVTSPVGTNGAVSSTFSPPPMERKGSSSEISGVVPQVTSSTGVGGGVVKSKSGELQIKRQGSIFFLADTAHTLYPCSDASKYSTMLSEMLSESLEVSRARVGGAGVGGASRPPQTARNVKRGPSVGSSIDLMRTDGVIMRPAPVDLLELSGSLFIPPTRGQRLVKLEDIACFGSNLLVLIEVQEREGGARRGSNIQAAQLSLGAKLNRRIGWKNRVASPTHRPLPAPSKKETPQSDNAAKVQDVSAILLPSEGKAKSVEVGTKTCSSTTVSRSSSDESYIPPWLKKEVEDALSGKQPAKLPATNEDDQTRDQPINPLNNAQPSNLPPQTHITQPAPINSQPPPQTASLTSQPPPQTASLATQPLPQTASLSSQPINQLPNSPNPNLPHPQPNPKLPPPQLNAKPLDTQPQGLIKQPSLLQLHPKAPEMQSPKGITSPGPIHAKKVWGSSKDIASLASDTITTTTPKPESERPSAGPPLATAAAPQGQPCSKEQRGAESQATASNANRDTAAASSPNQRTARPGATADRTLKERTANTAMDTTKTTDSKMAGSPGVQRTAPPTPHISPQKETNSNVSAEDDVGEAPGTTSNPKTSSSPLSNNSGVRPLSTRGGGGPRAPSTSLPVPLTTSHIRSRSDLTKGTKKPAGGKKSQSASQIADKTAERVKSPLAPTQEEGSDGEQLASPQNSEGSLTELPSDHSSQDKTPPKTAGKQAGNRIAAGDHGRKLKPISNAHKTGHAVEVTTISPYEVAANFQPKKPLPLSKRQRSQTAPSKNPQDHQPDTLDGPLPEEKEPSQDNTAADLAKVEKEKGEDDLLKGEVERLKSVVEEQKRMLMEGHEAVKQLQKKMSEMELQKQPEQNGNAVANDAVQSDPQPSPQKRRSIFKNKDKRTSSKVCTVM